MTSGIARFVDHLAAGFQTAGHDVSIISSERIRRWSVGEFRISSFAAHWPRIARQLPSFDVVNVIGPAPTLTDAFLALSRTIPEHRRPAIVYTHICSIDLPGLGIFCDAYGKLSRRLAQNADCIVVATDSYVPSMAIARGRHVEVVPWGADTQRFAGPPRTTREPGAALRVLFVGQMRPYKGIRQLLEAVVGEPRLELTIAGSGRQLDPLRTYAHQIGATNARFLGRVSDDALVDLYGANDVIVLPSTTRAEAFGLVLVEGMAAGCVPVASDLPGVRDVAGPSGVLVKPGDPSSLRRALLELADDPPRMMELSRASQVRGREFDWSRTVREYERISQESVLKVRTRRALATLPRRWAEPDVALSELTERFRASWGSLLLFDRPPHSAVRGAWGAKVALDVFGSLQPRIARHVAETRQPYLLGDQAPAGPLANLLTRTDIASAMSVPIEMHRGTIGVLSLSIAAGTGHNFTARDLELLTQLVRK